jgi:hypothetical protein
MASCSSNKVSELITSSLLLVDLHHLALIQGIGWLVLRL